MRKLPTALLAIWAVTCEAFSIEEFKSRPIPEYALHLEGKELVDYINAAQPFFHAAMSETPSETFKARIMDLKYMKADSANVKKIDYNGEIPESFDAREQWPYCKSIKTILDMSTCGNESSGISEAAAIQHKDFLSIAKHTYHKLNYSKKKAFVTVSFCEKTTNVTRSMDVTSRGLALSPISYVSHLRKRQLSLNGGSSYAERMAMIHSIRKINKPQKYYEAGQRDKYRPNLATKLMFETIISDADILACCKEFDGKVCGIGCQGGSSYMPWKYAVRFGVCSGGPYLARNTCKPYFYYPCPPSEPYYGECEPISINPKCRRICQLNYGKTYENDKTYAESAYYVEGGEEAMQREIMTNGPVQAMFEVYRDFFYYRDGIYAHSAGELIGAHSIKIIGWGVENGTKYWTAANLWNVRWGENGYFRILRGADECQIESLVTAGIMKV